MVLLLRTPRKNANANVKKYPPVRKANKVKAKVKARAITRAAATTRIRVIIRAATRVAAAKVASAPITRVVAEDTTITTTATINVHGLRTKPRAVATDQLEDKKVLKFHNAR